LPLDRAKEIRPTLAFERLFRIPVWYAYYAPDDDAWYWISALKAVEVGRPSSNGTYLHITLSEFAAVRENDDLGKLYAQRLWRGTGGHGA
jgi:hypothetical protein